MIEKVLQHLQAVWEQKMAVHRASAAAMSGAPLETAIIEADETAAAAVEEATSSSDGIGIDEQPGTSSDVSSSTNVALNNNVSENNNNKRNGQVSTDTSSGAIQVNPGTFIAATQNLGASASANDDFAGAPVASGQLNAASAQAQYQQYISQQQHQHQAPHHHQQPQHAHAAPGLFVCLFPL